jgi:hypothetical protein
MKKLESKGSFNYKNNSLKCKYYKLPQNLNNDEDLNSIQIYRLCIDRDDISMIFSYN